MVFPSLNITARAKSQIPSDHLNINPFNGIEIVDIDAPDIIIKSWSEFDINVKVKNNRMIPSIYTILVFLKYEGNCIDNKQNLIGWKTFQIGCSEEKNISIKCGTRLDWYKFLFKKYRVSDSDELFEEGSIKVKIVKGRYLRASIPRFLLSQTITPIAYSLMNKIFKGGKIIKFVIFVISKLISLKIFDYLLSYPLCVNWEERVTLIDPVIYDPKLYPVKIESYEIPEETDSEGEFKVNVTVNNSIDSVIPICAALYIESESIIPKIFSYYEEIVYIAGYNISKVSNNSNISFEMECKFPDENIFRPKYYDVRLILFFYLPVERNINHFGRSIVYLDANRFHESEEYRKFPSEVKDFWKDLGDNVTFCLPSCPKYTFCNPRVYGKIFFNEKSDWEETIEKILEDTIDEGHRLIPIIYFILLSLIGFFWVGYWIVRKKS